METTYVEDVIMYSELERIALDMHKNWGDEESFWRYEYNYASSVAKAIHQKAKIECGIPGADKPPAERTEDEKTLLRPLEHRRWNAYMRTLGYVYSEKRDDLAKHHPDLVEFSRLPESKQRNDD